MSRVPLIFLCPVSWQWRRIPLVQRSSPPQALASTILEPVSFTLAIFYSCLSLIFFCLSFLLHRKLSSFKILLILYDPFVSLSQNTIWVTWCRNMSLFFSSLVPIIFTTYIIMCLHYFSNLMIFYLCAIIFINCFISNLKMSRKNFLLPFESLVNFLLLGKCLLLFLSWLSEGW